MKDNPGEIGIYDRWLVVAALILVMLNKALLSEWLPGACDTICIFCLPNPSKTAFAVIVRL